MGRAGLFILLIAAMPAIAFGQTDPDFGADAYLSDAYDMGTEIGNFVSDIFLFACLLLFIFVCLIIIILRWVLRINVQVNLLQRIDRKLGILVDEGEPDPVGKNIKMSDLPGLPTIVPKKPKPTDPPATRPGISIDCPHCKKVFTVPPTMIGKKTTCLKCKNPFTIEAGE